MSISGSLVGYENINADNNNKNKNNKKNKNKQALTARSLHQHNNNQSSNNNSSMGKHCPSSLNSSISNSIVTTASSSLSHQNSHHHQEQQNHQQQQQQHQLQHQHQMNAKRKHGKYNNMLHPMDHLDHTNNLHLNSLWSIWYGVLLTLFQGYLAVHGAYRFLGCSLIQWKIEPVAELNLQIVLSGVVFILLPLFFTSAVFKVGNLANDGIKLASGGSRHRRCSMTPHDGLEEEARGGTLRALWTHGGPTAAFVHIVIALCLLLPRLLLEARVIENGLLPRESIWRSELDFISVQRRNLVVMSVMTSPYQNVSGGLEDEDYYNDTMFTAIDGASFIPKNNNNIDNNNIDNNKIDNNNIDNNKIDKNIKNNNPKKPNLFGVPDPKSMNRESLEDANDDDDNDDDDDDADDVMSRESIDGGHLRVEQLDSNELDEIMGGTTTTTITTTTGGTTATTTTTRRAWPTKTLEKIGSKAIGMQVKENRFDEGGRGQQQPITTTSTTAKAATSSSTSSSTLASSSTSTKTTTRKMTPSSTSTTAGEAPTTTTTSSTTTTVGTVDTTPPATQVGQPTRAHHQSHQSHQSHQNAAGSKSSRKHGHRQHRQRTQGHRRHHQNSNNNNNGNSNHNANYNNRLDNNPLDDLDTKLTSTFSSSSSSYEDLDYGRRSSSSGPKATSTIRTTTTTRDSNIHIVRPEMMPEIVPSTPVASNSKIIEIKTKSKRTKRLADDEMQVEIEPEYLIGNLPGAEEDETEAEAGDDDDDEFTASPMAATTTTTTTTTAPSSADEGIVRLDGFAGMLQIFFGIERPIDPIVFSQPPSAEFVNLLFALLVWCVRYPAVFWSTTKSFATVFSVQMVAAGLDIVFGYVGVSTLYKLQVYSEAMPIQNTGLILNGVVTLSLFLLSTVLLIASSMIMYLYGHGRLAAKMRDRSLITMKSSETWIYFAHCASLCFVLALAVVKAPLLNDLSATYRNNLHCSTFFSALISVVHILLWIVIWLGLTAKRRWTFKLPPVDSYGITKASTQPLLMTNRGSLTSSGGGGGSGGTPMGVGMGAGGGGIGGSIMEPKGVLSSASSTDCVEDIYWPKLTPSSPKLKVTFNEVTSTSDDVLLIGDHEQNHDGKRNSPRGAAVCFASASGEIDEGDYATLRSATTTTTTTTTVIGINGVAAAAALGGGIGVGGSGGNNIVVGGGGGGGGGISSTSVVIGTNMKILHLSEYDELPPPPPPLAATATTASTTNISGDYANCGIGILDDNTSEEGKLLACVRDDSVTYASTRDLEPPTATLSSSLLSSSPPPPPLPPHIVGSNNNMMGGVGVAPQAMPEIMQLSSSPEHLISPLAPVTVTVHTNEAHIASSSTPRCLRRADSGVPNEALTPRSDTTSTTESTTSPPERAPSESSSGVHSGEERDVEVVIRPRAICKPPPKPPQPPIQEEPYGRSTNMKMSSFINRDQSAAGANNNNNNNHRAAANSATLPLTRATPESKFDYSHCSTMPLPAAGHGGGSGGGVTANGGVGGYSSSSAGSMHGSHYAHFKPQVYANSSVAMAGFHGVKHQQQHQQLQQQLQQQQQQHQQLQQQQPQQHGTHTTLPNGVRYSNPHFLRRLPHVTMSAAESPYGHLGLGAGHHTFSKLLHDPLQNSLVSTTIPEDRDSANYSMSSDQDCHLYATANHMN